jgi:DNA-binding CsgD family transcriptional regulator
MHYLMEERMTEVNSLWEVARNVPGPEAPWMQFANDSSCLPDTAIETLAPPGNGVPSACLAALLDELDTGIVLCNERAQALLFNEAARRELADGGVLYLGADRTLSTVGGISLLALRRAVQNAALRGLRQLVPLRAGERKLMVAVQPLRTDPKTRPYAVLLLGRRQLCPELAVEMLGRLHSLTPAERRVLKGLVAGQPVTALARGHGVAVSTVRTQVASLRSKFGVKRVDDLMMLVAEMPPMVNALRTVSASN